MFEQLGLIGCGLMGGSFALALKRARLVKRVVGYSKSPSTTEKARQLGVIDVAAPSALLAVSGADIVLLAVPVAASEATFKAIRHGIGSDALVMDVGSTKGDVIEAARRGLQGQLGNFVPAHPIAGKEVSGIEHAEASLFTGRQVVLTPIKSTLRSNVQRASQVWSGIGANVLTMTHEEHDGAFAAVSHLPHLLAFAYVNGLAGQPQGDRFLGLAGPGFRDFSRIAASDPVMWRDVLLANREQVLAQSRAFRAALLEMENAMAEGESQALEQSIARARRVRAAWQPGASSSPDSQQDA
ncbi:prephenate dehydrogenase [Variovorax paradoxus]|jgi:prephenate dehydrogenase|uniref:prephenate dehydrogenase n=1 Tax=Variovorax TaxID=34072 RepID=UPI0006E61D97|nr:prephenate dehydrogenase/arogenate dehydrogenase family protein [Variovorax sp. CY25R-8]KPU93954.1 prephenate dehydrogenase [Variovorax paradoxus]KPU99046.1 prephenate dehydrogenase [Variovorax paradoxus]KPV11855.1 prephenate dehydrogenase [Variovorax paradoxus]KPV23634.1 prephenate dehydrogenase [Variovorax paradoxus]KPV36532.1 prephenate dehydrogenase [Variovorax paradoxus]